MKRFVNVARVDEVGRGAGKLVLLKGRSIALLNSDGAFYALEDRCPFDGASLSDGVVAGSLVECPGDGVSFFVPTGECFSEPEGEHLRSYRVRVDKEDIYVDLRESLALEKSEGDMGFGFSAGAVIDPAVL
jgi:nitrite reductase/ring-hydroxylating ferredoxin subunit